MPFFQAINESNQVIDLNLDVRRIILHGVSKHLFDYNYYSDILKLRQLSKGDQQYINSYLTKEIQEIFQFRDPATIFLGCENENEKQLLISFTLKYYSYFACVTKTLFSTRTAEDGDKTWHLVPNELKALQVSFPFDFNQYSFLKNNPIGAIYANIHNLSHDTKGPWSLIIHARQLGFQTDITDLTVDALTSSKSPIEKLVIVAKFVHHKTGKELEEFFKVNKEIATVLNNYSKAAQRLLHDRDLLVWMQVIRDKNATVLFSEIAEQYKSAMDVAAAENVQLGFFDLRKLVIILIAYPGQWQAVKTITTPTELFTILRDNQRNTIQKLFNMLTIEQIKNLKDLSNLLKGQTPQSLQFILEGYLTLNQFRKTISGPMRYLIRYSKILSTWTKEEFRAFTFSNPRPNYRMLQHIAQFKLALPAKLLRNVFDFINKNSIGSALVVNFIPRLEIVLKNIDVDLNKWKKLSQYTYNDQSLLTYLITQENEISNEQLSEIIKSFNEGRGLGKYTSKPVLPSVGGMFGALSQPASSMPANNVNNNNSTNLGKRDSENSESTQTKFQRQQ